MKKIEEKRWSVDFETTVLNDTYEDCTVSVVSIIYDNCGNEAASAKAEGKVPLREKTVLKYSANVFDPLLWNTDSPDLYTVKTVLASKNGMTDESKTRIGFREIELIAQEGLFVNGIKTFIKGVCCHQDFGLTGLAVPDNIARYKIELMKEMGTNGFRTTHYQNSAATMTPLMSWDFLLWMKRDGLRQQMKQWSSLKLL